MTLSPTYKRFFKYTAIGGPTFLFDISLLFILHTFLEISTTVLTPFCFLIALSLNYLLSRSFVFARTSESYKKSYSQFILMGGVGSILVTLGMYVGVELLSFHYLVVRIATASIVGIGNYLFNLYYTFKVAGKH
jgi:putative flippase GtrA